MFNSWAGRQKKGIDMNEEKLTFVELSTRQILSEIMYFPRLHSKRLFSKSFHDWGISWDEIAIVASQELSREGKL